MRYVLDTNIVLHIVRNSDVWKRVKTEFEITTNENKVFISIISYAEINSIAKQLNWGQPKQNILQNVLSKLPTLLINKKIAESYVKIDVYSQGKDFDNPLPSGISSRMLVKMIYG